MEAPIALGPLETGVKRPPSDIIKDWKSDFLDFLGKVDKEVGLGENGFIGNCLGARAWKRKTLGQTPLRRTKKKKRVLKGRSDSIEMVFGEDVGLE